MVVLVTMKARWLAVVLSMVPSVAHAQAPAIAAPAPARWANAAFVELSSSFVPVANDVVLMLSLGVRARDIHEVWARIGYMPVGDDIGHGLGAVGYRAALRPGRLVRPIVGALFAGLPAICTHDARGRPSCVHHPLFIVAANGGVRIESVPWLGFSALLSVGVDSYPNPFGMVELAASFALPLP